MANWKSFTIEVPGKDLLSPIRQVLETLLIFLDILKVILNTIKAFLIDFGNPIKVLVLALIKLIEELFLALKAQGVFGYFDIPNPTVDPNFDRHKGGFQAFTARFKGSLFDTKDFNRPQPRTSTLSGFVLLVVDAQDVFTLINRVKQLIRFFGKELTHPRYEAPANFKVIPVGAAGDPILAVASVFTKGPIEAIELQWTLPSSAETPDPGFSDVVGQMAADFVPPNFLIEKSVTVNPSSARIQLGELGGSQSAGIVEYNQPVNVDKSLASRFAEKTNGIVVSKQVLRDDHGEPFVKFQKYIKVGTGTGALGQLGRFRYIDTDVQAGTVYYYRVRPYSGKLDLDEPGQKINNMPTSIGQLGPKKNDDATTQRFFKWPSTDPQDDVVMGKPTGIIRTSIPVDTGNFDVTENLIRLFQTALSLDFHIPLPAKNPDGITTPTFDSAGNPDDNTLASSVGKGSLTNQAGQLAAFESQLVLELLASVDTPGEAKALGEPLPWQRFNVRRNARRIAVGAASALMQSGDAALTFRDFMRGPLPRGPINTGGKFLGETTLEAIVFAFTSPEDEEFTTEQDITGFKAAYDDVPLRQNILVVIQFLQNFSLGGAPVDWISISILRDIIPWAGQLLYDILDKIQALVDGFNGLLEEIKQFIDLLVRKIDALERFIKFLLDILNFIVSLQLSVFLLAANGLTGDASSWVSVIDNAGGDKPTSGPGGYSAGVGLAYVTPNAVPFVAAFKLIFGG